MRAPVAGELLPRGAASAVDSAEQLEAVWPLFGEVREALLRGGPDAHGVVVRGSVA